MNIEQLKAEGVRVAKELREIQDKILRLSNLSTDVGNILTDIIERKFRDDSERGDFPLPDHIDHGELVELAEVGPDSTMMVTRQGGELAAIVVQYDVSATVRYPTDAELQDHVKGMDSEVLDLLTACRPPAFQPLTEAE